MLSQLRDLDLQLLRLFVTVVESGGFSAAQGELGIGQSTISTQMAKLETRLGFRLCERGKAGFRLTPKGEQVLAATRKLFGAIETFKGEAQGMADKLLGELRIGLAERDAGGAALDVAHLAHRVGQGGDLLEAGGHGLDALLDPRAQIGERVRAQQRLTHQARHDQRKRQHVLGDIARGGGGRFGLFDLAVQVSVALLLWREWRGSRTPRGRKWHARRDSNPQPAVLETAALPIELLA